MSTGGTSLSPVSLVLNTFPEEDVDDDDGPAIAVAVTAAAGVANPSD